MPMFSKAPFVATYLLSPPQNKLYLVYIISIHHLRQSSDIGLMETY